jgi:hypothetical protein
VSVAAAAKIATVTESEPDADSSAAALVAHTHTRQTTLIFPFRSRSRVSIYSPLYPHGALEIERERKKEAKYQWDLTTLLDAHTYTATQHALLDSRFTLFTR